MLRGVPWMNDELRGNASISRDHAIHAMTVLEAGPVWTPEGWGDPDGVANDEVSA